MFSSPAKRRKTSRTTAVDASQTNMQSFDQSSRAGSHDPPSFQLPTKASLARSNRDSLPDEANRSPTRSPRRPGSASRDGPRGQDEGPGFGLRDRKAFRRSLASASPNPMSPLKSSPRKSLAFAVPPRRVSKRIMPSDLAFGSPIARNKAPEPSKTNAPEISGLDGADEADANMDPFPPFDFGEPDLPPTPTQLGMVVRGASKELMSSSPSARHATRARRRTMDTLKPSPPKVKGVDTAEQDLPELSLGQPLLPESVLEKQKLRRELSNEMQELKNDIAELQGLTEKLNGPDTNDVDFDKLISLLSTERSAGTVEATRSADIPISSLLSTLLPFSKNTRKPPRPASPLPTNPYALQESAEAGPYLKPFAPLTLSAHSNRVSASKTGPLRETHDLTFTAPHPFPARLYNIRISYESDPETQSLIGVSIPDGSHIPAVVRQWMDSRLANPLLKLDVSSLCWGINRYWEAAVSRAQIWTRLEKQHSNLITGQNHNPPDPDIDIDITNLTRSDLGNITTHLERSTMLFENPTRPNPKSKARTRTTSAKVLVSCTLTIDEWTSEPQLIPEISVMMTSPNRRVEDESKGLFLALLNENKSVQAQAGELGKDGNAVVRAAEGVLGSLFRGD